MAATRALLVARGADRAIPGFDVFWDDFSRYVELKHAHGTTAEAILAPVHTRFSHDVPAWIAAGMPADVTPFRFPSEQECEFRLSPARAREIEAALKVWTTSIKGLTKGVTRIRSVAQVRDCLVPECSPASHAQAG